LPRIQDLLCWFEMCHFDDNMKLLLEIRVFESFLWCLLGWNPIL
jgi:hypothetical protein